MTYFKKAQILVLVQVILALPIIANANPFATLFDWDTHTPGGNVIGVMSSEDDGCTLYRNERRFAMDYTKELAGLTQWYYYKGYILGQFQNDSEKGYFVFNEENFNLLKFSTEAKCEQYVEKQNLKPIIWTRWYKPANFENDLGFGIIILGSYLSQFIFLLCAVFLLYALFVAIWKKKYRPLKIIGAFIFVFTALILIVYAYSFLGYFHQSI